MPIASSSAPTRRSRPSRTCRSPGRPLLLGGLAAGGTDTDIALIARDVFKLNTQLVRGYGGSAELNLAIQRGEVEGRAIGMSSLQTGLGDWLRDGKLRFLMQFGHETALEGPAGRADRARGRQDRRGQGAA